MCYHPSLEYQLAAIPVNDSSYKADTVFAGIVNVHPRRRDLLQGLAADGVTTQVRTAVRVALPCLWQRHSDESDSGRCCFGGWGGGVFETFLSLES